MQIKYLWTQKRFRMNKRTKIKGYWTKERCQEEALKYQTRSSFKSGSAGAFSSAYQHGWLNDICQHMISMKTYYTKAECAEEALKYNTKTDFIKHARLYYSHAIRKGFLNEICQHMKKLGNPKKRVVYVFEFSDHHVYVGLTMNMERRIKEHLSHKNSAVHKHIQATGCPYQLKVLTNDYITMEDAAALEDNAIIDYAEKGWILLNKKRGGDLGNKIRKYTKRYCRTIALKYNDKTEFYKRERLIYRYIWRCGWLEELSAHMTQQKKANGYWTKERCAKEAHKYSKRAQFQRESPAAHSAAYKNGWLDEICSHMGYNTQEPKIWTQMRCKEEVDLYKTRGAFKSGNPSAYKIAMSHGWLNDLFKDKPFHGYKNERVMIANENHNINGHRNYWTKERIIEEAKKHNSMSVFKKKASGAYDAAYNLGIIDKVRTIFKSK